MTDLEQRLRLEFERQASTAPAPAGTERFAHSLLGSHRHHRLRWLIPAAAALVLIVPILTVVLAHRHRSVPPADTKGLVGIQWLLVRSVDTSGTSKAAPTGKLQQVLQFDGGGGISFNWACNYASGTARITSGQLAAIRVMVTAAGCGPQWDDAMGLLDSNGGTLRWRVVDRTLTITGHDGRELIFTVRPSIYPLDYPGSPNVTVTTGRIGTIDYRLSYVKNSDGKVYLFLEHRSAAGASWIQDDIGERIDWSGPQPDAVQGCHAGQAGQPNFLIGLATAQASTVTIRDDSTLAAKLYDLPGTGGLQAYLAYLGDARPGATLSVTDSAGTLLGQPCKLR